MVFCKTVHVTSNGETDYKLNSVENDYHYEPDTLNLFGDFLMSKLWSMLKCVW